MSEPVPAAGAGGDPQAAGPDPGAAASPPTAAQAAGPVGPAPGTTPAAPAPSATGPLGRQAPDWARDMAASYLAGAASVFILHGNIFDLVPVYGAAPGAGGRGGEAEARPTAFVSLEDYLAGQIFGRRDVVLDYDRGAGICFLDGGDAQRGAAMRRDFDRTLEAIDLVNDTTYARSRPKDPKVVFEILDRYILHKVLASAESQEGKRKSVAILIRYVEMIAPTVEVSWLSGEIGSNLVKLLNWANDATIRGADVTICLFAANLAELNRRLVENPFIAKVEVPLPGERERRELIENLLATDPTLAKEVGATAGGIDAAVLARESNGLTLVGVSQVLRRTLAGGDQPTRLSYLKRAKKEMIEKECFGLVEFVEPRYTLDMVVAQAEVRRRLEEDARLIREARFDALPMGYLLCGVLGTGKTFTSTCFAGSIGIPAIVFKNLREKWVGASEGNMQKVLQVVRALGPVVVIVDEADAALGKRSAQGDSGTSSRMFAMIAAQMSDTEYRGRVIWMLLTARPDLLTVDLKRQGRCEVHIPLFAPQSEEERRQMLLAMARKNDVAVDASALPAVPEGLSGADIESLVVQAKRQAAIRGLAAPTAEVLADVVGRFVSPNYSLHKELQQLVAIREATDLEFLPERFRPFVTDADQAATMERRIQELTVMLGEG